MGANTNLKGKDLLKFLIKSADIDPKTIEPELNRIINKLQFNQDTLSTEQIRQVMIQYLKECETAIKTSISLHKKEIPNQKEFGIIEA